MGLAGFLLPHAPPYSKAFASGTPNGGFCVRGHVSTADIYGLVTVRVLFVANLLSISPRVRAKRMRKRRGPVRAGEDDVVRVRSFVRIQAREVPHTFGDLMIGARGVPADTKTADAGLV